MGEKIYVVVASSGEYSDRAEWVVCAYRDEADAKLHVARGDTRQRERELKNKNHQSYEASWANEFGGGDSRWFEDTELCSDMRLDGTKKTAPVP